MDKEDFLTAAMALLKQYIDEDEGIALDLLEALGYSLEDSEDIITMTLNWKS
jgi:hypothetical protein